MAQNDKRFDYDPMIYDVMRESATRLGGEFIDLANHAGTEAEREAFIVADRGLMNEARQVDAHDVEAVKAMTDEFGERLRMIEDAEKQDERKAA
ncbi:hypothetical protein [Bifidobacterium tibiigranuli]|jgi:hypothetical protein|uniref:Uncharacterized protein n=1 Tax=Bifidobacterium tibiigranuli TaxID=2172043 RepID=A0A5N6S5J0_9BIFI|nr:hypothetical protein [Bifidobacterium tibiigranuli]KAE8128699.1 hypothetical protein DDE84_04340 [Bifidobacterium tibiigranuli]KAE8128890.1 hypothetical protein DDF78_04130 [Bifidobacterium tibiigranuli]